MKTLFFLASILCFTFIAYGQEIQVVSGENNEPIPYARVEIKNAEGVVIQVLTNENGVFKLSDVHAKHPEQFLKIKAYGYETYEDTIKHDNHPKQCPLRPLVKMMDNIVVTGQISQTNLEKAVQKVRVIDRQTIEAKGAVNLRDVLMNELNIRITQDQMLGSGLKMLGMSGENVKILIDGVPVIGRMDGNIDLSQINLNNIERIEIVEGPLSVAYGSNAMAGTINLISKKTIKNGHEIQLNSFYETVGNYNIDGRLTYNRNKHKISVYGGRNFFDGWNDTDKFLEIPKSKLADSGRFNRWKPKEQYHFGANYTFQLKRTTLSPYMELFDEKVTNRGLPRAPQNITAFDDYYYTRRSNQGLHFTSYLKEKYKIQGVVAHNYFNRKKNTYITDLTNLNQSLSLTDSDQDTSQFRTFMSRATFSQYSQESKANWELGYDVSYEIAKGRKIDQGEKQIGDYAIYGTIDWKATDNLMIKPGVRSMYNTEYGFYTIPSLNFKQTIKENTNIRGSYATGYRAPSVKELYMIFVDINHNIYGNSTLTPEKSHHFQLWLNHNWKIDSINKLKFELNGYYQNVNDKIALSQNSDATIYSYFNIDKFETTGSRFQMDYSRKNLNVKLGAAMVAVRTNYGGKKFANSPELSAALTYRIEALNLGLNAFYKYTGKQYSFIQDESTGEVNEFFIQKYNTLDISASTDFFNKRLIVSVGGRNLLNVRSVVSNSAATTHSAGGASTPIAWGRSIFVKIQFNFNTYKK